MPSPPKNNSNITIKRLTDEEIIVPFPTDGTGTISSVGNLVTGTGTLFTKELQRNSILWNKDAEWRVVKDVISDTELVLESAFSDNLSTNDVSFIPPNEQNAKNIKVFFIGQNGQVITTEGATIPFGYEINLINNTSASSTGDLIPPIIVNAQSTDCLITLIRY